MIRLVVTTILAAFSGGITVFLLSDGLAEGAITGMVIGASVGVIIGARRSGSGAAFEFEAAGIHDDNLTTIVRRNLVREANRDNFAAPRPGHDLDDSGKAKRSLKPESALNSEVAHNAGMRLTDSESTRQGQSGVKADDRSRATNEQS